jgi:Zn-dependent peptidase ImmA (M78 family)
MFNFLMPKRKLNSRLNSQRKGVSNLSNHRYNAFCASVFGVPLKAAAVQLL